MITQDELKKLVTYNPETGEMFWLPRPREMFKSKLRADYWNRRFAYKKSGSFDRYGYIKLSIFNKEYRAHRIIWLYFYGEFPKNHIDHIDGDPCNNRISNLRDVTHKENHKNTCKPKNNTSGFIGVWRCRKRNKWVAEIMVNYKKKQLGRFDDINDAIKARQDAEIKYGFHKNHGRDQQC